MSQFQNEAFQFHFVKSLVQTLSQSVSMATDLSFHFIESFISSKSILMTSSQVIHT